jgi:signal transduction histidine kinase/DNA-binding response OmpR family regulator
VKATDVNGLWSSLVTKIQVDKAPAFYETWWAYTAYIMFVLLAGYSFYYRTKRRMQLRHELRIVQIEKEKSEELVQAKLRYFTNISHDLLTPLTIVTCLIDDAEITYKNKIPQFEMIRANVNRLKRLLQQILDFRKVESGNMRLKVTSGDIVSFIRDVCKSNFMPLIQKKKLTFTFESSEETIQAYFDADKIDKVVFNLLSNACKYTEEGGEIKTILSTYLQNGHIYLSIIISDTGKGIASEDLDKIFTRFYTNQHWVSSETNGIGLSLTKDLLELHHGTISVESEIEKGTSFTVIIPIDKESYVEDEINVGAFQGLIKESRTDIIDVDMENWEQFEGGNTDAMVSDIRLLLVEDNEELLYLMERILSRRYHVIMAKNGIEAFELMKDNEVDIIVSDVMMPEMDGLELCRAIKGNLETSHIPIILLTAKNTAEDRIECYNAGANAYISKPFELKVLEARLDNFLMDKKTKQEEFRTDIEDINFNLLDATDIDKEFLKKVIEVIQENLSSSTFDVIQLADALAMSKSSLYRKTKAIIGLSPVEFIRNVRLKQGVKMLKNKSISVSEVAYTCGFSNPKYFSTCFKEEFGVTPKEFQKADTKNK